MPVQVEWDDDDRRIIRQVYSGYITLDDYTQAVDQVAEMVSQVPHTVHSIMDRRAITASPSSALPALLYANRRLPGNLGLRLVIAPSIYTRMIVNIGRRVAPRVIHQVYFAETLEEARLIIQEHITARDAAE